MIPKTSERINPVNFKSKVEYLLYLRHLFAYEFAEMKFSQDCSVLEVGSGEGYGTKLLSDSTKVKEIIGLDVDLESIKEASNKYISGSLTYRHYNGHKIPFETSSFDFVVSFQVIEHIEDDMNFVNEVFRVLKKNGIFILTTPNRLNRLKPGQKPMNKYHIREYDAETLKKLLLQKFSDVAISGIFGNEEIQQIEMERIRTAHKLYALDPFNFRKFVSPSLKSFFLKIIKPGSFKMKLDDSFLLEYQTKQFYTINENLDNSLDIIGVCIKV